MFASDFIKKASIALTSVALIFALTGPATQACAADTVPTPKASAKAKATTKKATKTTSKKKKVSKKYGYKGKADASDMTLAPNLSPMTGGITDANGAAFVLPDVASASKIMKLWQEDITCELIADPTKGAPISILGDLKNDTIAGCKSLDSAKDPFYAYVLTSKEAVAKYNNAAGVTKYKSFTSPVTSQSGKTYFPPSSKAIIFTVGGDAAFEANEIIWGVIYNLGFQPPVR